MPSWSALVLFVPACLALSIVPGPAVLYIVSRSVEQGRAAGIVSAAGIGVGNLVQAAAAALGISLIVARSAELFTALKYAGAAYLIGLGLIRIVRRVPDDEASVVVPRRLRRVFGQAVVVNVLNPKVAIFFLALLPQFVTAGRATAPQILVLGLVWTLLAFGTDAIYALASAYVADRVRLRRVLVERVTGSIYVGLGVLAAAARRPIERAA